MPPEGMAESLCPSRTHGSGSWRETPKGVGCVKGDPRPSSLQGGRGSLDPSEALELFAS
ncbi:hypothetical protein CRG98_032490 [Punica granatum]|uniref:Uncharacterized protein n=1 Tax=Punica granatum TaxID=22663 RepID=A0A2I0ISY6_PUNGR|nr:hypothetical protein CRG98_032490 [Punica granatum]